MKKLLVDRVSIKTPAHRELHVAAHDPPTDGQARQSLRHQLAVGDDISGKPRD
jgi:uncharacterized protein YggU (UPF0235/DUF167 family)